MRAAANAGAMQASNRRPRRMGLVVFGTIALGAGLLMSLWPICVSEPSIDAGATFDYGNVFVTGDDLDSAKTFHCERRWSATQGIAFVLGVTGALSIWRGLLRDKVNSAPAPLGERWEEPRHHDPPGFP